MDTALYYTYSTIAQALASAMGLLAAFALYRITAISNECMGLAVIMEADTGGGINVRAMATASNWSGVREAIESRLRTGYDVDTNLARCFRLDLLVKAQSALLFALWVSLGFTASVVVSSICVLAFVPSIIASCNGQTVLNAGIFATAVCLCTYVWLVVKAFEG